DQSEDGQDAGHGRVAAVPSAATPAYDWHSDSGPNRRKSPDRRNRPGEQAADRRSRQVAQDHDGDRQGGSQRANRGREKGGERTGGCVQVARGTEKESPCRTRER